MKLREASSAALLLNSCRTTEPGSEGCPAADRSWPCTGLGVTGTPPCGLGAHDAGFEWSSKTVQGCMPCSVRPWVRSTHVTRLASLVDPRTWPWAHVWCSAVMPMQLSGCQAPGFSTEQALAS